MKQFFNDWMFYLRMFFDKFFINVLSVSVSFALGMGFICMVMYLDMESVLAASQERMTVMAVIVFSVATAISVVEMIMTALEDAISKKEEEAAKKEAVQCSEKVTSPSA